jgi:hypothetical protein
MSPTFILYFVVPIGAGTLILLVAGALFLLDARKDNPGNAPYAKDWNLAGGKVLSAQRREHGADPAAKFDAVVEYAYNVDGTEHRGTTVFTAKSEINAQNILAKYPANFYVPVRYNPKAPEESLLWDASLQPVSRTLLAAQVLVAFGLLVCCFTAFMAFVIVSGMSYVAR